MSTINRTIVLNSLIKHETLTLPDIQKTENLGMVADKAHLDFLLSELVDSGHLHTMDGVEPLTYTITSKGIDEGARLNAIPESSERAL